jgi:hypothetical protein
MKRWHVVHLAAALTLAVGALTLTACGGGGGGSGADSEGPTARPLMALNADNAPETVRDVFMVLAGGTDILSEDLLPQSVDATAGGGDAGSSPLETVQDVTRLVRGKLNAGTSVSALSGDPGDRTTAQETFEVDCWSGTFTYSETSTSASFVFNDCVEYEEEDGQWVRLDGGLDITNIVETWDGKCIDEFRASFQFRNLTIQTYTDPGLTEPVESVSIDGRADIEEVLDSCTGTDWFRMSGNYLGLVVDGTSVAYFAFDLRTEESWAAEHSEYDYTATLDISTLPGSIDVTTLKLITRFWVDEYPNGGVLRLDAANSGYLLFTINDAVYDDPIAVSIEADFNGDGIWDCDVGVSWEALEAASWDCLPPKR